MGHKLNYIFSATGLMMVLQVENIPWIIFLCWFVFECLDDFVNGIFNEDCDQNLDQEE
jgi:hypothetical protein